MESFLKRISTKVLVECCLAAVAILLLTLPLAIRDQRKCRSSEKSDSDDDWNISPVNDHYNSHNSGQSRWPLSSCGEFPSWDLPDEQEKWSICWRDHIRQFHSTKGKNFTQTVQHMALQILNRTLAGIDKVILLDLANFENKGDPGMGLGELNFMAMLGKQVVFYCEYRCQAKRDWQAARDIIAKEGRENIAVLSHGGGNIGSYPERDYKRFEMIATFPDVKLVILSQSVFFKDEEHLAFSAFKYQSHPDLTMLLRNQYSYEVIREHMPGVKAVLAPDMAYGIGHIERYMEPIYDVLLIHRTDREAVDQGKFKFPPNITYSDLDWHQPWRTPKADNLIHQLHLLSHNGFFYLQRGRVLITDRLHGHIFASMMDDYPVVLLDNQFHKLQDFRDTWTSGLETVETAHSAQDAVEKAVRLLHKYYPRPYSHKEEFISKLVQLERASSQE